MNENECLWIIEEDFFIKNEYHWKTNCGHQFPIGTKYEPLCPQCGENVLMIGGCIHRTGNMRWESIKHNLPPAGVQLYVLMYFKDMGVWKGFWDGMFPHDIEYEFRGELDDIRRWSFADSADDMPPIPHLPDAWCEIKEPNLEQIESIAHNAMISVSLASAASYMLDKFDSKGVVKR